MRDGRRRIDSGGIMKGWGRAVVEGRVGVRVGLGRGRGRVGRKGVGMRRGMRLRLGIDQGGHLGREEVGRGNRRGTVGVVGIVRVVNGIDWYFEGSVVSFVLCRIYVVTGRGGPWLL